MKKPKAIADFEMAIRLNSIPAMLAFLSTTKVETLLEAAKEIGEIVDMPYLLQEAFVSGGTKVGGFLHDTMGWKVGDPAHRIWDAAFRSTEIQSPSKSNAEALFFWLIGRNYVSAEDALRVAILSEAVELVRLMKMAGFDIEKLSQYKPKDEKFDVFSECKTWELNHKKTMLKDFQELGVVETKQTPE